MADAEFPQGRIHVLVAKTIARKGVVARAYPESEARDLRLSHRVDDRYVSLYMTCESRAILHFCKWLPQTSRQRGRLRSMAIIM